MRAHGTRERYVRGPDERDEPGSGCRCADCRAANTANANRIYQMKAMGRWQPYVDAAPVRAHVAELMRQGYPAKRIARLAGVAPATIGRLIAGCGRVRASTAQAILSVGAGLDSLPARARVDGTGTRRRVQALVAVGWSLARLAAEAGIARSQFQLLVHAEGVSAGTARAVRVLYSALWDQPPPSATARERQAADASRAWASREGWPPPAAWDDDELDDPSGWPARKARRRTRAAA